MEKNNTSKYLRVLPFKGIANFRDLGGYPTQDGRETRWGALYRSGQLDRMRTADMKLFNQLSIHTLVDFRSRSEMEKYPNRLPENHSLNILELPVLDQANQAMESEIRQRIKERDYAGFDPGVKMMQSYRQFAADFTAEFRSFIQAVLRAEGKPVLWHCVAGKDRTGFAAMILLRILGVQEETITQDYLLSKTHIDRRRASLVLLTLLAGRQAAALVRPLLDVRVDWIQAASRAIEEHWGGFEEYVRDGLGLSDQDISRLQDYTLS
ncbi:MAG: tyrosine-protein phosphatase [Anaerolineales bacterium]|nr:tyrosine-protein phosphatase [Anaerolineales bacterium]